MPDLAPNPELLRSLGRLVRGLSALFWGLPVCLIVCFNAAKTEVLRPFGILPPLLATGWLLYGLWQLGHFQKQERIWRRALDYATLFGLLDFGLSPFLYWWGRMPGHPFFGPMVALLVLSGLIFLNNFNLVLHRLSAMLPDETLRLETRNFTTVNRGLLLGAVVLASSYRALTYFHSLPADLVVVLELMERGGYSWWLLFTVLPLAVFVLLPLATTMALLWKIKETILDGVFGSESRIG